MDSKFAAKAAALTLGGVLAGSVIGGLDNLFEKNKNKQDINTDYNEMMINGSAEARPDTLKEDTLYVKKRTLHLSPSKAKQDTIKEDTLYIKGR